MLNPWKGGNNSTSRPNYVSSFDNNITQKLKIAKSLWIALMPASANKGHCVWIVASLDSAVKPIWSRMCHFLIKQR